MLYHVPDLERGIAGIARVLQPGGTLIATTHSVKAQSGRELEQLLGIEPDPLRYSFSAENGERLLRPHFTTLTRRMLNYRLVFPDHHALRRYVAALPTRSPLAEHVPIFDGPFTTTPDPIAIFTATKGAAISQTKQ